MSDTGHIKCPRCGKELTAAAPEGLCPACLGALNFATETELPGVEAREALPPLTPQELAPHFPQLEILECLGRGGMGVVYKARQRTLNRLVALKLLAPERVQDAKFADRFAREAQALAALNHPNIVTIHDFGKAGGFYYLLMEFVDGVNLRQLLRSRKLQSSEALAIVPPICEALQYAHEHGIVHRDIKPENLLLAKDGRVKIADFGIAKMLGSEATSASVSLSSSGGEGQGEEAPEASVTQHTTMGTPQYMAPEQRDSSQSADHRADIYSLGVVLYELLTGELPADKLQPPSRKVQIDVRLDEIVLRALEKTPALRYQTAGEFKTQVETLTTLPAATKPASLLKLARGRYTTPEFLATPTGGFRKHLGWGELSLFSDHLVFTAGGKRTVIPFTALRQLGNSRGPLWTSPIGHEYLSLIYEDNGQPCHLMFMPGEFMFSRAQTTADAAQEWVTAIQAAVQSAGGKPVPVVTDGPLVIPASPRLAALMVVPLLCPLAFAWWMLSYGVVRPAGSSLPHEPFRLTILAPLLIIVLGFLAVMAFSSRKRPSANKSVPANKSNRLLLFTGFLTVVVLGVGFGLLQNEKSQRDQRQFAAGPRVALSVPGMALRPVNHSPFIARLPDGGSVELLAVRLLTTSTNAPWWKPDGTPSSYGGDLAMEGMLKSNGGVLGLLKVTWPQNSTNIAGFTMEAGRFALKNRMRQPIEELRVEHFDRAIANNDTTTLSLETGVRAWQTVMSFKPGLGDYIFGGQRRRQWEISETAAGNLRVSCRKIFRQPGNEYSLAVVDKRGKIWTPTSTRIATTSGQLEGEYEASFDGIGSENIGKVTLQDVEEIRWRSRPYDYIEFQNVSLKPGKITQVSVKEFISDTKPPSLATNVIAENVAQVATTAVTSSTSEASSGSSSPGMIPFWSIILVFLFLGLGVGGLVLTIWLSRKKGLKGCLLAGAIMLGVLLGLVGLVLLLSFGYRASKTNSFNAPAGTTLDLRPIGLQAPASQPNGLAMQVQNGFNIRASGGQLVTFEFFMRQGDDRLEPLPQLTAKLVTAPGKFFEGSVSWMGKRGDDARSTNQLWFWSVNGYQQGGVPLPSRPDYETNLTHHLRSGEVLNWWQLAIPAQVNLMPGAAPQDIPLFRTFGSATLDPKQPKEAIVRVTCEALPAGYQFGREQYELLLGTKNNKTAGTDGAKANPAALPRSLVPQSVVDEARAEAKRAAALFADARTTRTKVLDAEYHLKWAEAMFNGDVRSALQAKRDGAALKLESIDLLIKAGRGSTADRAKAVRELAEAEAAMAQLSQAKPSALVDDQPVPTKRLVIKSVQDLADVKGARRPSSQTQEVTNTRPGAISLRSTTPLLPGESITAHLRYPDGHLEDAGASYIVSHAQGEDRPSLSLFWSVPPGFSSTQQNSMLAQMKAHEQSGFLTLTQGVPTTVFSITNTAGMVVCGEAQYECHEQAPEAVFLHLGRIFSINDRNLLVYFTAGMSSGSLLRASVWVDGKDTGESDLQLSLSRSKSMNGNLSWKIPPVMETNATALAMAQVETLIKQGPIRLLPGARQTVFKLTNTLGVTLKGCLELLPIPGTPARAALRSQVDAPVVSAEKLMSFETVGASDALISATSVTPFGPGEKLVVRTRMSNGHFEQAVPQQTTTRYDLAGYTFTILQWRLPETFLSQAEEVSRQLQRFQQARLLALPPGVPVNVFTVTNSAGITLMGELLYRREVVGTNENARTAEIQITSSAAVSGAPWVYFKASVPVGCQLLARKESSTDRPGETSINQENAIWRWTSGMSEAEASEALQQVSAFAARGPFNVSLGKPTELFSVTNSAGEVFSGSLELVGKKP